MVNAVTLQRLGGGNTYGAGYNSAYDNSLNPTGGLFSCGNSMTNPLGMTNFDMFGGLGMGMYGMGGFGMDMFGGMGGFGMGFGGLGMGMYGMTAKECKEWNKLNSEEKQEKMAELYQRNLEAKERLNTAFTDAGLKAQERAQRRQNYLAQPIKAAQQEAIELKRLILENRKDDVVEQYNKFKAAVSQIPGKKRVEAYEVEKNGKTVKEYKEVDFSDKELQAEALRFYAETTKSDLLSDIDKNLADSFTQSFKKSLSFQLLGDREDSASLKNKILSRREDGADKAARVVGKSLGGAATGAAIGAGVGALCGSIFGGVGAIPGGWLGGKIGAVIGGIVGNFA